MLWTDAIFVTQADLTTVDEDVTSVASAQGITISSTIQRAIEESGNFLEGVMASFATYISSNDLSANHLNAVFYTGSQPNQRRRITLDQVNVNGRNAAIWSEIKQWMVNQVLIKFYSTAANRAQGDRYVDKLDRYRKDDVQRFWPRLQKSGIPVVYRPMPCPGAFQSINPGTWTAGATSMGGATLDQTVTVALSYLDSTPPNPGNGESNLSVGKTVTLTPGQGIVIDATNLNPPTGNVAPQAISRGFTVYGTAGYWCIYVAGTDGVFYFQARVPVSQRTYTFTGDPVFTNAAANALNATAIGPAVGILAIPPGTGQWIEAFLTVSNVIIRG